MRRYRIRTGPNEPNVRIVRFNNPNQYLGRWHGRVVVIREHELWPWWPNMISEIATRPSDRRVFGRRHPISPLVLLVKRIERIL